MSAHHEVPERRKRQRIVTAHESGARFSVEIPGQARLALQDLSLEGFAVPVAAPLDPAQPFDFTLHFADAAPIRGTARAVNFVALAAGAQAGCLFESFEGDGRARLEAWLTRHVFDGAWVPITEEDAKSIVNGPSLI